MPVHAIERTTSRRKVERLETRVTREQKRLLQRAAELSGRSLSDFVISSAQEAAARAVQHYQVMTLSARDQEIFVNSLLHTPRPNAKLRAALKSYRAAKAR